MPEIVLTGGGGLHAAVVDACDLGSLLKFNWHALVKPDGRVYAITTRGGRTQRMHRVILTATKGQIVDHINGDSLDNRRKNLRVVSHSGNSRNRRPRGKSGFLGVSRSSAKTVETWRAYLGLGDGVKEYLGTFWRQEDAALAYDRALRIRAVEGANLNFPDVTAYVGLDDRRCPARPGRAGYSAFRDEADR